jgi:hypothetical protein
LFEFIEQGGRNSIAGGVFDGFKAEREQISAGGIAVDVLEYSRSWGWR